MTINMTDSHIISITQIKEFLKVDSAIKFKAVSKKEKYKWIDDVLNRFKYFSLRKRIKVLKVISKLLNKLLIWQTKSQIIIFSKK